MKDMGTRGEANKQPKKRPRLLVFLILHLSLLLYSVAGVCSKMAAGFSFLSWEFIGWYGAMLFLLGIYALVWQQILKRLPLTTAFANKGVTLIWGFFWGALIFAEHIDITMLIGAALVFCGILLVVISDE
jgi:drug/metabolite transporter (DMT)-like permease